MEEVADTELMEEEILYESRTDRDVNKLTAEVRAVLDAQTAALKELAAEVGAAVEAAARDLLTSGVATVDGAALNDQCGPEGELWLEFGDRWTATLEDALDVAKARYDGALEAHGTRTHQRLRWLKGRYLESLDTQRRAADAERASLGKKEVRRVKAETKRLTETHHKAIAELASTHAKGQTDAALSRSELERQLVLTEAQLERERTAAHNLRSELALFVNADGGAGENEDDKVLALFRRVEATLSATGLERTEEHTAGNLYRRRPDPAERRARKRAGGSESDDGGSPRDDDASSDGESVASTETAVGLDPDAFRLLKSEILQLRVAKASLEKAVKDAERESSKANYNAVELKQQKADVEKANADLQSKISKMKNEHRKTLKTVADLEVNLRNAERANAPDFGHREGRSREKSHRTLSGGQDSRGRRGSTVRARPPADKASPAGRESRGGDDAAPRESRAKLDRDDGARLDSPDSDGGAPRRGEPRSPGSPGYDRATNRLGVSGVDHFPLGPESDRSGSDLGTDSQELESRGRSRVEEKREYERVAARLRERLQHEARNAAESVARAAALETRVASSLARVAKLELVLSEKNALLAEMTKLARAQRTHAKQAEETLSRVRLEFGGKSHSAGLLVLSTAQASKPTSRLSRAASHPAYYQHGATRMTTPVLEPVTGHLVQVGAPYRHAPLHQAPVVGSLRDKLQTQLRRSANDKLYGADVH